MEFDTTLKRVAAGLIAAVSIFSVAKVGFDWLGVQDRDAAALPQVVEALDRVADRLETVEVTQEAVVQYNMKKARELREESP